MDEPHFQSQELQFREGSFNVFWYRDNREKSTRTTLLNCLALRMNVFPLRGAFRWESHLETAMVRNYVVPEVPRVSTV